MNPKVSIVMPIFNHSKERLETAINSILNQTFKDFELIIVDGSSNNKNFEIISCIKDERIKYFKTKGYINCLNTGIEHSSGIYIARMDSDDISLPTRIEEQVSFLDNNPQIDLCSCLVEYFGANNRISPNSSELTLLNLIKCQEIVHPSIMFRKNINVKYKNIKPLEDCLLFRELLLNDCRFSIMNKVLMKIYVSPNSIMMTYPQYCKFLMSKINVFTLSKYYNFNLSFIDKLLSAKSFSEQEIFEYLSLILFLKEKLKRTNLKLAKICLPLFSYMFFKHKNKYFIFKNQLFYQTILPLYLEMLIKSIPQFLFSMKNKWIKNKKIKIVCICGIKFKFKIREI